MTIEEYKEEIEVFLIKEVGDYNAKILLKLYYEEILSFYEEKLTVGQAGTLIILGY